MRALKAPAIASMLLVLTGCAARKPRPRHQARPLRSVPGGQDMNNFLLDLLA
jgi:hypothetical protein